MVQAELLQSERDPAAYDMKKEKESRKNMKQYKGICQKDSCQKNSVPQDAYQDILYLQHPTSQKYPRMSASDRAAQFSPFAALTGYGDAVEEAGRLTAAKKELGEYELEQLNRRLQYLRERSEQGEHREVTVTYFCPDEKKAGGSYISYQGRVKRVDGYRMCLVMTDGFEIAIDEIMEIEGVF